MTLKVGQCPENGLSEYLKTADFCLTGGMTCAGDSGGGTFGKIKELGRTKYLLQGIHFYRY